MEQENRLNLEDPLIRKQEIERRRETDIRIHELMPLVIGAAEAHHNQNVVYDGDWNVAFRHPDLELLTGKKEIIIPPIHQIPVSAGIMADTAKPLADTPEGREISEQFSESYDEWMQLSMENYEKGVPGEIDWGTYVLDVLHKDLYHFAPKNIHKLSLLPSNMAFFNSDEARIIKETLAQLQEKVVGVAGLSVGRNIVEGWVRNVRPNTIKMIDGDTPEGSNYNRLMQESFRSYIQPRSERVEPGFPFGDQRYKKVHTAARGVQLIDPYMDTYVYDTYLTETNIDQFIIGNDKEPSIDILVEEIDDIHMKIKLREYCRKNRIPVVMASDFGSLSVVSYWDFANNPNLSIAKGLDDENFSTLYEQFRQGGKKELRMLIEAFCGVRFQKPKDYKETPEETALYQKMQLVDLPEQIFSNYLYGVGKQFVTSIPQKGSTALMAGGAGGEFLVDWALGKEMPEIMIAGLFSAIK